MQTPHLHPNITLASLILTTVEDYNDDDADNDNNNGEDDLSSVPYF